jgi:hypothetical protein
MEWREVDGCRGLRWEAASRRLVVMIIGLLRTGGSGDLREAKGNVENEAPGERP